jgi:hypothetical protein
MFESSVKFTVKCATWDCTVRIEPSIQNAYCACCKQARNALDTEAVRVANYHRSTAWGR